MAMYTNVIQEFRGEIEPLLSLDYMFDTVIDILISEKLIDEKLYFEIWGQPNRVNRLLDIILKDANRCDKFINILGTVPNMKTISDSIRTSINEIYRMIVVGGFPPFSVNYVVRNSVAAKIKEAALQLNPKICSTLIIYGLPGFGKSSLVNQVLQTKQFFEVSGGTMFWINLGEHSDTTNVINSLWSLYLSAVRLTEEAAIAHRPEDISLLQKEVKKIFLHEHLQDSYIILDDVKSPEVLNVFKLPCKSIVTTQDKDIARNFEATFIRVTTGFTKKESLELLRKSLDTDNFWSNENFADQIHVLCDGCPMLLNIIGSILRDSREALQDDAIWKSLIQEIVNNNHLLHPLTQNVIHMIEVLVNRLNPHVRECFHSLAVFPKHVNIRPEILMKLWEKSASSVRSTMVELENKSLIVSFYNKDLRTYVYSIHSLVHTYLVEKIHVDTKYYHAHLMTVCDDSIIDSPLNDPIGNYIFGYYGYHAKHGEMYDRFEKYFDLKFIENKIKRVGSADLLTDFEMYKDLITGKEATLQRKLEEYTKFVHAYSAHLNVSPETNIVQFAFFHDNNSVYEEAKSIACNSRDQLYFKLESYSGIQKNFSTLKARKDAVSACFIDPKQILVGTLDGTIEVKSFHQYQHGVQRFEGHTDQVFTLELSSDRKRFLSISSDRSVKVWKFEVELDVQSPKLKQSFWQNLHSPDENMETHKTFRLQDNDHITSAAFPYDGSHEIVTASKNGKITRWDTKAATVIKESAMGLPISQISYTHDSQQIMSSYDGKIFIYWREHLQYRGQFRSLEEISDLVLVPIFSDSREVAVFGGKKFEVWDYVHKKMRFKYATDSKISSVTANDEYLVIGTEYGIYLYDYKVQEVVYKVKNNHGEPSSLFIDNDRIIFISLDKENVQRFELCLEPIERRRVHDLSLFGCYWKESLPISFPTSSPIYFIVNAGNKIDIFNGNFSITTGTDINDTIKYATFSLCGTHLILGTQSGNVFFYNYKTTKITSLPICDEEINLVKCFEVDFPHVDSSSVKTCEMTVVASSRKIAVITHNRITNEIDISNEISNILYLQDQLIIVDRSGKLFIKEVAFKIPGWSDWECEGVIVADTNKEKSILAIAFRDSTDFKLKVCDLNNPNTEVSLFETRLDSEPKCLCFSTSGKLLSVGCKNGDIKIFNIETKTQTVLNLHKSVEKLLFASNFESILVSLGDQIAWWNLDGMLNNSDTNLENPWKNKKLHDTVPYLLTSTNFHGKELRYISASKDFRSFLVIDLDGNIFKMDVFDS